jgi:hypothetical protein
MMMVLDDDDDEIGTLFHPYDSKLETKDDDVVDCLKKKMFGSCKHDLQADCMKIDDQKKSFLKIVEHVDDDDEGGLPEH